MTLERMTKLFMSIAIAVSVSSICEIIFLSGRNTIGYFLCKVNHFGTSHNNLSLSTATFTHRHFIYYSERNQCTFIFRSSFSFFIKRKVLREFRLINLLLLLFIFSLNRSLVRFNKKRTSRYKSANLFACC